MTKIIAWFAIGLLAYSAQAGEGIMNKLLSPGPLIIGHKNLEGSDCLKCHVFNQGVPNSKCLDCHKEIEKAVASKRGFHGLTTKSCIACHSDHKGREFDSAKIDIHNFDHKLTGYALEGKHKEIHCEECHKEKRRKKDLRKNDPHYLGLVSSCISCHQKEDPHHFSGKLASKDCNECHSTTSWKLQIRFNHDTETNYKLEGKHREVKCADCHKPQRDGRPKYQIPELPTRQCLTCHKDQHAGKFSAKFQNGDCLKCHGMQTWKLEKYDHATTGFELKGKHAKIDCLECHKQTEKSKSLKDFSYKGLHSQCITCHENYHKFSPQPGHKLGDLRSCATCHNETNWRSNFNHSTDTHFEIGGKHIGVKCDSCHVPNPANKQFRVYVWTDLNTKTCELCHKNPHLGSFTKQNLAKRCSDCHVDLGWRETKKANFNHDKSTRFSLTGRHREISCAACHSINKKEVYKFPSVEKQFCVDCHTNVHIGQFSEKLNQESCIKCHGTSSFQERPAFDHNSTRFFLTGKHRETKCEDCHKETKETFAEKPYRRKRQFIFSHADQKFCVDCHDNVHTKQFHQAFSDQACSHCHTTNNFVKRLPFLHSETTFPLKGKHLEVACSKCHENTGKTFPQTKHHIRNFIFNLPFGNCETCHKDPHRGSFGKQCVECHQENSWRKTNEFHKNFTLNGVHFSLSCTECHKDSRLLEGLSDKCIVCHQKDDIHFGKLPNCGECHRQIFWENSNFNHGLTLFALRGIHRTLDCDACHSNGIYKGLPNQCADCHLSQALSFGGSPNHQLLMGRSCSDCHNQFSFH